MNRQSEAPIARSGMVATATAMTRSIAVVVVGMHAVLTIGCRKVRTVVEVGCRPNVFSVDWGQCTFTSDGVAESVCIYIEVTCPNEKLRSAKVCSGRFAGSDTVTKPILFRGKQPSRFQDDNCQMQIVEADAGRPRSPRIWWPGCYHKPLPASGS